MLFGEEVEEETIEGARGPGVADRHRVGEGGDFEVGGTVAVGVGRFGALWG